MSFSKASQILELSEMVAAHRRGINHDDVMERFRCSLRTAQRMMSFLEYMYPDVVSYFDEEGRKRWRFEDKKPNQRTRLDYSDLLMLKLVDLAFKTNGSAHLSSIASRLREKVISVFPILNTNGQDNEEKDPRDLFSFETRPHIDEEFIIEIESSLIQAIKASLIIELDYGNNGETRKIKVEPYGILLGKNSRLVGRDIQLAKIKCFSFYLINNVTITNEIFERPKDFKLQEFSERLFDGADDDSDFCEVHWRFIGDAGEEAKKYVFHPKQKVEVSGDGAVHVQFKAAGQKDMCQFLIGWGRGVEVISPDSLKVSYDQAKKARQ